MLLVAIVTASSVSYNFATVISDASTSAKKDHHLVVMASEVKVLNIAQYGTFIFLFKIIIQKLQIQKKIEKKQFLITFEKFSVSVKILRNSTGHQIGLEGVSPLMLDWLSRRYKFKYLIFSNTVYLPSTDTHQQLIARITEVNTYLV